MKNIKYNFFANQSWQNNVSHFDQNPYHRNGANFIGNSLNPMTDGGGGGGAIIARTDFDRL